MRKWFYYSIILAGILFISGCTSLQLLTLGASSISYAVTGKSLSDHALSTVMNEDCALHRIVMGEKVCIDSQQGGVLAAVQTTPGRPQPRPLSGNESYWQDLPVNHPSQQPQTTTQTASPTLTYGHKISPVSPDETVKQLMAQTHQAEGPTAKPQSVDAVIVDSSVEVGVVTASSERFDESMVNDEPRLFAVLGSYNDLHFARESLAEFPALKARVINNPARLTDKSATLYRVVAGPMTEAEFAANLAPSMDAWRIRLCPDTMTPPPCSMPMLAQRSK